jgi:fluoride exporter
MINLALVGAGGAFGAMARYLTGQGFQRLLGPGQPYVATLAVNVVGGLLMGLLIGALALRGDGDERWRLLLGVGVLGGFTTFSAFALEAVAMLERRAYGLMAAYVAGSVLLSMLALMAGLTLARRTFA